MDAAPGPHCTPAEFRALGTMDGLESLLTPFVCLLTPLWLHPFSQCLANHPGCSCFPTGAVCPSPMSPGSLMLQTGPCYLAM